MAVLKRLVRLLNLSFDMGVVSMDWRGACVVPLYKGKGDKCECSNSRGISLLRACVRVGNDVSEWFPVNVGLRQGCLMFHGCLMYIWMVWFER